MSIAAFVALMDRAGVEVGLLRAGNQLITDVLAQYPKRFIGLATISPHDGMRGVRELVRLVQEHGFGGLRVSCTVQHGPGQRSPVLPALREMRGTRHAGAHLYQHELCDRPAVRSRPSAPSRPGRDGFPGTAHRCRTERLAVGQRDGRAAAAASEPLLPIPRRIIRAISPRPARVGSSSCSSATRCCRTRSWSACRAAAFGVPMEELIGE